MRARRARARFVPLALVLACSERPLGDTDSGSGSGSDTGTNTTADAPTTGGGLAIPFDPISLEVADFDGDGRPDLLIMGVDEGGGIAGQLARGSGDGTFAAGVDPMFDSSSAYPAVGRLGDGPGVDVMVAQGAGVAQIYRWSGAGFVAAGALQSPGAPRTHTVLDFDADGRSEVLALYHGDPQFGLTLHRQGDQAPDWSATTTDLGQLSDFAPRGLLVGHLDGDLLLDALVYEPGAARGLLRVLGGPDGGFHGPAFQVPDLQPSIAALADFDEDGRLDLLVIEALASRLSFVPGDGAGNFAPGATLELAPGFVPRAVDIDDLDDDGHLDLIAADADTAMVRVWSGRGDGTFDAPSSLALPSGAVRVHVVQLDDDPRLDLVAATFAAGDVTVLLNPVAAP